MNIYANIESKDINYQAILDAIKFMKEHEVLIGVPESSAARESDDDSPINNAELMFIHTNGSPANGIPPRPVLEPAIELNQERIAESMKKAIDAAVEGNVSGVIPALEMAGKEGRSVAQKFFTDPANGWPANSDITVHGGWMKNKKSGKIFRVKGKGSTNPLIDTGALRQAITYVVREVER